VGEGGHSNMYKHNKPVFPSQQRKMYSREKEEICFLLIFIVLLVIGWAGIA
jgi:hypothetical protein